MIAACRVWWNAALPLIPSPAECELLQKPLDVLLNCILRTTNVSSTSAAGDVDVSYKSSNSDHCFKDTPITSLIIVCIYVTSQYRCLFEVVIGSGRVEVWVVVVSDW